MRTSESQTWSDMAMVTIDSGMERSAGQFTQLLEATGVSAWPDEDVIVETKIAL
jgi:hypothetical protein